ncbi:synaptonemal complex protein 1 [Phtheirospermum japonicum]|uniref:Synaptonemal complex protein 1 n=1 Tax=Phtheirospermum japonicum TaxID=374723 RepID=A0A830CPE8_9LAMI|nr:synaptonemal complex protein 1 [Phtheirospermum japonicum]
MSRLLGLSGIRSLEQFRSLPGYNPGAADRKMPPSSSLAPSNSVPSGSVANLKLTAEKLVREQASAKNDLDLANSKLKKLTDQICIMEEKLQNAFNENAQLKVKQNEDEKLWRGLESKLSSTKTLCSQLTETLQQLNVQVQQAEKDKAVFGDKLSATSAALDKLHEHMKSMSLRLESSEETIKTREKELVELGLAKDTMETSFKNELNRAACVLEEKDGTIKQLEEDVAANKMALESLTCKMEKLQLEIRVKEDDVLELSMSKEKLEGENKDLLSSKNEFANRLEMALTEINNLEDFVSMLFVKFRELEDQSLTFSKKVNELSNSFDSCLKLAQQEKDLVIECAQRKFDQIHDQCTSVIYEKNALQLVNQDLNNKVLELQKEQEFAMVQHAEECRLEEEKIRKLESEAETLVSKQTEMQSLIVKLEDNLKISSENSRLSDKNMQDLSLKYSELENNSNGLMDGLKADIRMKQDEIDLLQKEVEESAEKIDSLEKRVSELEIALEEKEQFVVELKTREKLLDDQKAEITESLADTERKLEEAKKQYDHMLENKHSELSKHLKEISQRNDQAINDIRRKYDVEKQETVNLEKEKADKVIQDMEKRSEQKLAEYKEKFQQHLVRVQEEHAAMISNIQQEHANKEMSLISKHAEELKRTELQAETELREKTKSLRSEHEAQLRSLRCEHEDECKRLQEELDIQKSKEEKQRALLQMQWKVMSNNAQEDQEVTSKKVQIPDNISSVMLRALANYSITSKRRNKDSGNRFPRAPDRTPVEKKDSPCLKATQTPVSNLLKTVENPNNLPKHSRKVTHHEYEIETSNGRTITKRRKTKSTVMFGRVGITEFMPSAVLAIERLYIVKGRAPPNPSNIGDLFTEGSLNPYADDPYAFD